MWSHFNWSSKLFLYHSLFLVQQCFPFYFVTIILVQGWFVRPIKSDIKARDLLLCYDRDSPAHFTLELEQIVSNVTNVGLELVVSQTGTNVSQDNKHSMIKLSLNTNQSSSARSSSGCSSLSLSPPCPPPSGQLRLSPAVRMYLCAALDNGDWTRLAAGLRLSRHLTSWMETQASPTDFIWMISMVPNLIHFLILE